MIELRSAPVAKERLFIESRSPALRTDGYLVFKFRTDCGTATVAELRLVIRNRISAARTERVYVL